LAVVDVTDGADVHVGLGALERSFCHESFPPGFCPQADKPEHYIKTALVRAGSAPLKIEMRPM
ncbi:hypothetical protein, partial [Deinococcus wulumuqiensis]|uniref:hypothetical protein n=1 Tax=Deinococcus wulumuqiensis TaxID=980427 RepID=UPI003571017F